MKRPKTMPEYQDLVEQALIEVDEMRHIINYEMDDDGKQAGFLVPLEAELERLKEAMATDAYEFRDEDLQIMSCMSKVEFEGLPFKYLLDVINWTHRMGLESEG
ncbi:MAG: hypothetical protein GY731_02870 [Gammaproteobacteria bacterium]|nr:hypothetical protein [Gammaproteobacteria bacterium]